MAVREGVRNRQTRGRAKAKFYNMEGRINGNPVLGKCEVEAT